MIFWVILESKDLVFEFVDGFGFFEVKSFGSFFEVVDYGRGVVEKKFDIFGGFGELFLYKLLVIVFF